MHFYRRCRRRTRVGVVTSRVVLIVRMLVSMGMGMLVSVRMLVMMVWVIVVVMMMRVIGRHRRRADLPRSDLLADPSAHRVGPGVFPATEAVSHAPHPHGRLLKARQGTEDGGTGGRHQFAPRIGGGDGHAGRGQEFQRRRRRDRRPRNRW
mgnify:CR=1 FL=1